MSPTLRPCLAALTLVIIGAARAQTVLLRFKPPVGMSYSYQITMSVSQTSPGMPTPMNISIFTPTTLRIVKRVGSGTTMESRIGQSKAKVPAGSRIAGMTAQLEKMGSNATETAACDELGQLNTNGGSNLIFSLMSGGMMSQGAQGILYPAKPVRVGDSWTPSPDISKRFGKAGVSGGGQYLHRLSANFPAEPWLQDSRDDCDDDEGQDRHVHFSRQG
jgi:hypothetical protein